MFRVKCLTPNVWSKCLSPQMSNPPMSNVKYIQCASGYPISKHNSSYRWLCGDCRQTCVSCSYAIVSNQTFKCLQCWRIIHRRCVDPQVTPSSWKTVFSKFLASFGVSKFGLDMYRLSPSRASCSSYRKVFLLWFLSPSTLPTRILMYSLPIINFFVLSWIVKRHSTI